MELPDSFHISAEIGSDVLKELSKSKDKSVICLLTKSEFKRIGSPIIVEEQADRDSKKSTIQNKYLVNGYSMSYLRRMGTNNEPTFSNSSFETKTLKSTNP